jgi:hypothetical protein
MSKLENENLYETRNNLVKEITLLTYDEFNSRPDMDKWSIAQVCHHVILTEKASTNAIAFGLKTSNSTNKERKNVHLMLDRTKKRKAPKIVEPNVEPFEVLQIIDMLNDSRKKLLTLLNTVKDKSILVEKSVQHPVFGELSLNQWIEFLYLHEQRHIEQIKEVKLGIGVRD